MVAAILHRLEAVPSNFAEKLLWQSRASVSSGGGSAEEASCEDLERVIIDTDLKIMVRY